MSDDYLVESTATSNRPAWFVGAMTDGVDQTERFINEGIWWNGYENKHLDLVQQIAPGDRIAIKSTYVKSRDLPFNNDGKPVSIMAIKAIGIVTENLGDGRTVRVNWNPMPYRREWYFYTYRKTIWKVTPGTPMADNLLDFTFNGAPQDIAYFLNDTSWGSRYSGTKAWLVRGNNVDGHDLVPSWLANSKITLSAKYLRPVEPHITREELKEIVDEDYAHASYAQRGEKLDELLAFLSKMSEGDIVATVRQSRLYLGRIVGDVKAADSAEGQHILTRDVTWVSTDGIDYADLPSDLANRLSVQRDVLDLTAQLDLLEDFVTAEAEHEPLPEPEDVTLPRATKELADKLLVNQEWLQECIDLLDDRRQLIFYGPPGTGKTYLAQEIAKFVAGDNVRLVQFHPSYSYEDFFEGFRPKESGGFELKPGPMRRIVDQANSNPSVPHVLIIDEINRGNLAKVFGELYFLLEYRDQNVELLYTSDDFSLPKNVYIIGTMNTADRSIALVDAAMRRRFAFLPLHPAEAPTRDILRLWLAAKGLPNHTAEVLDTLNSQIDDPEFAIGPSYFMRESVHHPSGLERVWRTSILPLLEEQYYGELSRDEIHRKFGLNSIESKLANQSSKAVADVSGNASTDGFIQSDDSPGGW